MKQIRTYSFYKTVAICLILFLSGGVSSLVFAGNIFINLVAVNPLDEDNEGAEVKHYLPEELTQEDIVDAGGLDIDYDIEKKCYYLHGKIAMKAKESKNIRIEVKDVWYLNPAEIEVIKDQVEGNLSLIEDKPYYDSAVALKENMFRKLDYVLAQQVNYSEKIGRRIEEYRAHAKIVDEIRENAFSLDYFKDAEAELMEEQTVKFIIEVTNPSLEEGQSLKHKHYLPMEIQSDDVVEKHGFEVRFDEKKKQSYLEKEEEFKAGETKRYEIVIKDVWRIPLPEIDLIRERAGTVLEDLASDDYLEEEYTRNAAYLVDSINTELDTIVKTQKNKEDMKKYIGSYRSNKKRLEKCNKYLDKLKKLLALAKAKRLEDLENKKVKNVLQKIQALRGIAALSKAIFGKRPSVTMTWKVIWGSMAFVAFFTTIHFFTWWKRSKLMGEDMAQPGGKLEEVKEKDEEPEAE